MKKRLILSSLLCFLFLTACADSDQKSEPDPDVVKAPIPICPQVAIIRDLQNVADYGNEAPDPSQLVFRAHLKSLEGDCAYIKDKAGVDIGFSLNFVAARGPRLGGLHTSIPYFIALVDPDDKIITKMQMTKEFGFSSSEKITEDSEDLHVFIPITKDKWALGPNYRVLIGFQLNEEQVKAARNRADFLRF